MEWRTRYEWMKDIFLLLLYNIYHPLYNIYYPLYNIYHPSIIHLSSLIIINRSSNIFLIIYVLITYHLIFSSYYYHHHLSLSSTHLIIVITISIIIIIMFVRSLRISSMVTPTGSCRWSIMVMVKVISELDAVYVTNYCRYDC